MTVIDEFWTNPIQLSRPDNVFVNVRHYFINIIFRYLNRYGQYLFGIFRIFSTHIIYGVMRDVKRAVPCAADAFITAFVGSLSVKPYK